MAQLGNLIVNGVSRLLSKLYVSDSVTAPNFIGKLTGNADTATKLTSSAGSATQPVYFSDGKPVATTYTLGKSVPANAVFTDTNTWRGVQNNLTSTATDQSLSAAQGKVLKGLIDGKAASGHTHNYAGSSSAGGAATSANKVNAALTINLNGTSQGAWDGSSAKSISITAASVGATSVTISRW